MDEISFREFDWERHSDIVKGFHEDIVTSSFLPRHMLFEDYLRLLRSSEEHGLPAYMRGLRQAHEERKDGMFVWEREGETVGWSWLKVHENEFFREGIFGEVNEIYVVPRWRQKGFGRTMMEHALEWMRTRGVRTIRVETVASNHAALKFYEEYGFKPNYMILQKEIE
ncbi:MAG: GNAT family N-acetyltransferase [Candidatus Bathyarchaeota archaeon]|jgi:ribosomal protein S18 acetylase RimI-like enzyme